MARASSRSVTGSARMRSISPQHARLGRLGVRRRRAHVGDEERRAGAERAQHADRVGQAALVAQLGEQAPRHARRPARCRARAPPGSPARSSAGPEVADQDLRLLHGPLDHAAIAPRGVAAAEPGAIGAPAGGRHSRKRRSAARSTGRRVHVPAHGQHHPVGPIDRRVVAVQRGPVDPLDALAAADARPRVGMRRRRGPTSTASKARWNGVSPRVWIALWISRRSRSISSSRQRRPQRDLGHRAPAASSQLRASAVPRTSPYSTSPEASSEPPRSSMASVSCSAV